MLLPRILTALALLLVLGTVLLVPDPLAFDLFMALAVSAALWEWLRLSLADARDGSSQSRAAVWLALGFGLLLIALRILPSGRPALDWLGDSPLFPALSFWWVVVLIPFYLRKADPAQAPRSPGLSLFAPFALFGAWYGAVAAFEQGPLFLLSLLALVWVADIGAYFIGRRFGRRKLAPAISPGKSIEGAIGGCALSVVFVLISAAYPGTFGAALVARWGVVLAAVFAAVLAIISVGGDLFESLLKRRAGRKDSSSLLPGHGGVLDRIDALIPVLPVTVVLL